MFHCGEIKLSQCHSELVSGCQAGCTAKYPLLEARDKVKCLIEQVRNIPVIASEESLSERIGEFPSPMEEGVGERVQLEEKINPSLKIVSFHKMLKDNFSLSLGERSKNPCDQSEIIRSSLTDLLQSNCLSLRMTNVENVSNNSRHPEQSEGSALKF